MKTMKRMIAFAMAAALMVGATGCGSGSSAADDSKIVIYDGQFAEMQLIHRMVKLLVEEHTDATVEIRDEMAPVNSYNEVKGGNADIMNSYDGTLLTTFLHLDPSDVPEGQSLYDFANEQAAAEGVELLDKLGTNNTYIVAVPQAVAEQYNLSKTSDLIPVAGELVFGAEHDFFTEEGSAKYDPFVEFYNLQFKEAKQVDINLRYSAIETGNIDVTVAYATDSENKSLNMVLLEDDLGFFPEYNGAILVRSDLFDRLSETAPNLREVLNMLGGIFTDEMMVELSYQVDMEQRDVTEVAREFLQQQGLLAA